MIISFELIVNGILYCFLKLITVQISLNVLEIMKDCHMYFLYLGSGGGDTSGTSIGIIVGLAVGLPLLLCCCILCTLCIPICVRRFWIGQPLRSNSTYIHSGLAMQHDMSESVFVSGNFESFYVQYGKHHGPSNMTLTFYPDADYMVHGGGQDNVGTYIITGIYSPRTLRMGLEKHYQRGTGDPSENLGHIVTIQVQWYSESQQFEGKYYVQTSKHHDENKFIIRFQNKRHLRPYTIESRV